MGESELELKTHSSRLSEGMEVGGEIKDQDLWCGAQEVGGLLWPFTQIAKMYRRNSRAEEEVSVVR